MALDLTQVLIHEELISGGPILSRTMPGRYTLVPGGSPPTS